MKVWEKKLQGCPACSVLYGNRNVWGRHDQLFHFVPFVALCQLQHTCDNHICLTINIFVLLFINIEQWLRNSENTNIFLHQCSLEIGRKWKAASKQTLTFITYILLKHPILQALIVLWSTQRSICTGLGLGRLITTYHLLQNSLHTALVHTDHHHLHER